MSLHSLVLCGSDEHQRNTLMEVNNLANCFQYHCRMGYPIQMDFDLVQMMQLYTPLHLKYENVCERLLLRVQGICIASLYLILNNSALCKQLQLLHKTEHCTQIPIC